MMGVLDFEANEPIAIIARATPLVSMRNTKVSAKNNFIAQTACIAKEFINL